MNGVILFLFQLPNFIEFRQKISEERYIMLL